MLTFLRLWIVFAICDVVKKTMAQQCPSERSISGWMLQGHVYKTMLADIGLPCLLVCRTDSRCQSFKFVISSRMCELNNRTKEAKPEDFIPDPDRYYFRNPVHRGNLNIINFVSNKSASSNKWFQLCLILISPTGLQPERLSLVRKLRWARKKEPDSSTGCLR